MTAMKIEVLPNAEVVAQKAAEFIAVEARTAVAARGRFVIAVSGGHTPWVMLRDLYKLIPTLASFSMVGVTVEARLRTAFCAVCPVMLPLPTAELGRKEFPFW